MNGIGGTVRTIIVALHIAHFILVAWKPSPNYNLYRKDLEQLSLLHTKIVT